jgi:hypothetical protein
MKHQIEQFKNELTDRITFYDITDNPIKNGDACLFVNPNSLLKLAKHYKKTILTNFGNICIYIRLENKRQSKFIFPNNGDRKKSIVFTVFDDDFIEKTNAKKLECIVGDYSNMSKEWKKHIKFDQANIAASQILKVFNK